MLNTVLIAGPFDHLEVPSNAGIILEGSILEIVCYVRKIFTANAFGNNFTELPLPSIVIASVGDNTGGSSFTLTCTAENLINNLVGMTELEWAGTNISSSSMNTLDLVFTPLRTSDGGVFKCQWTFTALDLSFHSQSSFSLTVNSKNS